MENKKSKNIWYVGLLSFFGGISQDIFAPILPVYLTSILGFDKTVVGIAEGIVTASSNFFAIVAGYLADKFKKQKPIIFLGYFLSMVGRVCLVFFTSIGSVVGLRLLDGTGKGIKEPPKDVLIAGSSEKDVRGKSFGIATMLDTLGSVAGPLILFVLLWIFEKSGVASKPLYDNILFFSAIPLIITLLLIFKLRELPKSSVIASHSEAIQGEGTDSGLPRRFAPRNDNTSLPTTFYIFIFIIIIFTLGNSSDAFLILRAKNLGITLLEIPLVIALFNFVYALAAVPFGSLSDKIGRVPTLIIGWLAYTLVYFGFAVATHAALIWFLYAFYGIYYAISMGVSKAFLADIVSPNHRGRAFGIYGMTVGLTTLPASFFAGFMWDKFGAQVPFYFGATMSLIACTLLFIFSQKYLKKLDKQGII